MATSKRKGASVAALRKEVASLLSADERTVYEASQGCTPQEIASELRHIVVAKFATQIEQCQPDVTGAVDRFAMSGFRGFVKKVTDSLSYEIELGCGTPDVMVVKPSWPPPVEPDKPKLAAELQREVVRRVPTKVMK